MTRLRRSGPWRWGVLTVAGGMLAALPFTAPAAHAAQLTAGRANAETQTVTLPTGDQVSVSEDGRFETVGGAAGRGTAGSFISRQVNGDRFVTPVTALPFLGRGLDPNLFDVSALLRDRTNGRIPVKITFAAGASQSPPAGVTLTTAAAGKTWNGFLTSASARAFGAALDRAARAGSKPASLFPGVQSVTYAGQGPAAAAKPQFAMRTLILNVLDDQGQPVNAADLAVVNTDDARAYTGYPIAVDGQARISVPDGHYTAAAQMFRFNPDGTTVARLVFKDFTVAGSAKSVTLDARTATSRISVDTPRPARLLGEAIGWYRGSADGYGTNFTQLLDPSTTSYVAGNNAATGVQHYYVQAHLESASTASRPYAYDLQFVSNGPIKSDQHYRAAPGSLATVHSAYYSDTPNLVGNTARFSHLPWEPTSFRFYYPLVQPTQRLEYVTAQPDLQYEQAVYASATDARVEGVMIGADHYYRPGQSATEDWWRGPIAPGFPTDDGIGVYPCRACRTENSLQLLPADATDSTSDHTGFLDSTATGVVSTQHFRLYRAGTLIADVTGQAGGTFLVPAQGAAYRAVLDQVRTTDWTKLSSRSHTEWTFRSVRSDHTTVPTRWNCGTGSNTNCSALSLLTAGIRLNEALDGHVQPGPASLQLTVGHTSGAKATPLVHAAVWVSYDHGATWHQTRLRPTGHSTYRAKWTIPHTAGAAAVSLKVTARDAAGATITQTVTDAALVA